MTSLIKQHAFAEADIQPLDWSHGAASGDQGRRQPASAPLRDPAVAALEADNQRLRQEVAELRSAHAEALAAARKQARADAEREFIRDEAQALGLIRNGVDQAVRDAGERFAHADALAALMCQTALETVFADASAYAGLVEASLVRQLRQLRLETVLGITVSRADFQDEAALHALAKILADGRIDIRSDDRLATGACRISLRLGEVELSVADHWVQLQALLAGLAGARS